jgi:hypothetical protein
MTIENHLLKLVFSRPLFDENKVTPFWWDPETRIKTRIAKSGNRFGIFLYSIYYHK